MGTVSYILCCARANCRVCIVPSIQHYSGRRVLVKRQFVYLIGGKVLPSPVSNRLIVSGVL